MRPDELHTAFNFDFLRCPWDRNRLRTSIEGALATHAPVDAPTTWVLSNHDVTRPVTRYGRADTAFSFETKREGTPTDLQRGTRRARAAALLAMALPGSLYVYQGEELGLPEVEDIPSDRRQDPMWLRSGGVDPGRDGCRIPLPWSGDRPPYGFSANGVEQTWLDQPADWAQLTVAAESAESTSTLALYREGLRLRRATRFSPSSAGSGSSVSSTLARRRSNCPPAPSSYSPATTLKEVRYRRTPRSGSAGSRPNTASDRSRKEGR